MQMKRSRAFMRKKETPQCACCGGKLNEKDQGRVDNVVLCGTCNYALRERGFCHIDESGGAHTFWVLKDNHIRKVTLIPSQYAEFCRDPKYLLEA